MAAQMSAKARPSWLRTFRSWGAVWWMQSIRITNRAPESARDKRQHLHATERACISFYAGYCGHGEEEV
jgi:hypothetical protein